MHDPIIDCYYFIAQIPLETALGITMRPKNGVYLKLVARSDNENT